MPITKNKDVVLVRFKLEIPAGKWLRLLSEKYPHVDLKILSMFLIDKNRGNLLLKIEGVALGNVMSQIIENLKGIDSKLLVNTSSLLLLQLKMTEPWILRVLTDLRLMIRYPVDVKRGWFEFEFVADRSKIDNLFNFFDREKFKIQLRRISHFRRKKILTEKQREVLNHLLQVGYFEIPRKKSMTEISRALNISTSALSEMLRRIQKKLAMNYFET